jgi:hypothetical protein
MKIIHSKKIARPAFTGTSRFSPAVPDRGAQADCRHRRTTLRVYGLVRQLRLEYRT